MIRLVNENPNTRVKSALFGDNSGKIKTFAVMTAENPLAKELSAEENNKLTKSFMKRLKSMGLQYIKIAGSYGAKEHSFMIFNLAFKDAQYLAKEYNQLAFFYGINGEPSEISYYETKDECKTYSKIETKKGAATVNDAEDFFSRHGDFKFVFDMDYFKESVDKIGSNIKDMSEFELSLDETLTIHGRMIHRFSSRRKA